MASIDLRSDSAIETFDHAIGRGYLGLMNRY